MAKLSARGRTEIGRLVKDCSGTNVLGEEIIVRTKLAFMSDGNVLINRGFGWKVKGKIKRDSTVEKALESYRNHGWKDGK